MEDRKLPITVGQGAGAQVVTLDLPEFTMIGATTRAGPPDHAVARPLRRHPPPGASTSRADLARDRPALGRHPRAWRWTTREPRRSPRAPAEPRGWPTVCSGARATSPRCAGAGHIDASVAREALDLLEVDEAGTRPARPRDPVVASARSSAAVRWDCPRLPWPWARRRTRSRTCTSPICSSRASSCGRPAGAWPRMPLPPHRGGAARRQRPAALLDPWLTCPLGHRLPFKPSCPSSSARTAGTVASPRSGPPASRAAPVPARSVASGSSSSSSTTTTRLPTPPSSCSTSRLG